MCISLEPARMSNTTLYAAEAMKDGRYIHIIGYQNQVEDLSGKPNAMILPFPAAVAMGPENIVDTRSFPSFMRDYAEAVRPRYRSIWGSSRGLPANSVQMFESGSYTVVLAEDPTLIPEALTLVPEAKRPTISDALLQSFVKLYPGETVAVCCWAGSIKPEPLLWWYEPKDRENFRLPALDAHDGGAPWAHQVDVDHTVVFGSLVQHSGTVAFRQGFTVPHALAPFLAPLVEGSQYQGKMPNGDFVLPVSKLHSHSTGGVQRVFPGTV